MAEHCRLHCFIVSHTARNEWLYIYDRIVPSVDIIGFSLKHVQGFYLCDQLCKESFSDLSVSFCPLQERSDVLLITETAGKFVSFSWTEDPTTSQSHASLQLPLFTCRTSAKEWTLLPRRTWPEKCVCTGVLGCMTVSECFWAEVRGCRLHWEAFLPLNDYDICLHDCKASWVGKRFRSSGSPMKETSRWVSLSFFLKVQTLVVNL